MHRSVRCVFTPAAPLRSLLETPPGIHQHRRGIRNPPFPGMCRHVCSQEAAPLKGQVITLFLFVSPEMSPQKRRSSREAATFLQKGAHHPSGACQGSAAPPDLAGAVPAQLWSHSAPPISPLPCRCPPTTDALMSPGGRVYLEDKGHLETLSTQAGGRELNDLQEEPLTL